VKGGRRRETKMARRKVIGDSESEARQAANNEDPPSRVLV